MRTMLLRRATATTFMRRSNIGTHPNLGVLASSRMQGALFHHPQAIVYGHSQRRVQTYLLQRALHTSLTLASTSPRSAACVSCKAGTTPEADHSQESTPPATNNASDIQPQHQLPIRSFTFWLDPPTWRRSAVNTLHCLLGCSIGDFSALFIFANYFPQVSMLIVMPVAMASGIVSSTLLESLRLKYTLPSLGWRGAVRTALNMSFLSMLTMEAAENATNVFLARSMNDSVGTHTASADTMSSLATTLMMDAQHPYFVLSLGLSTLAGFLAPLPYNYYVVRRYNKRCH